MHNTRQDGHDKGPVTEVTGPIVVAGTGFEPVTSGL